MLSHRRWDIGIENGRMKSEQLINCYRFVGESSLRVHTGIHLILVC